MPKYTRFFVGWGFPRREKEAKAKLLLKVELVCNLASIVILAGYSTDVPGTCNECDVFQKINFTDNVRIAFEHLCSNYFNHWYSVYHRNPNINKGSGGYSL